MVRDSLADVRDILNTNTTALQNMVQGTKSIRQSYAASTAGNMEAMFHCDEDFVDELITSPVYRRAFRSFPKHRARGSIGATSGRYTTQESASGMTMTGAVSFRRNAFIQGWERMSVPVSRLRIERLLPVLPILSSGRNKEIDDMLLKAVHDGKRSQVGKFLDQGANIEAFDRADGTFTDKCIILQPRSSGGAFVQTFTYMTRSPEHEKLSFC